MVRKLIPLCEKIGRERIEQQIHRFYEKLRKDEEMKGFFAHIPDFAEHEQRIADFWWTAMGGRLDHDPGIDMVGRHMPLGIEDRHIGRWLAYFRETLFEVMEPELAEQWFMMAEGIAMRLRQVVVQGEIPGMPRRPSEPRG